MKIERIVVIGAGNGGHATAVDLTKRGFSICLYEFPQFAAKLAGKLDQKRLKSKGCIEGSINVSHITTDINEALDYSDYLIVTMPAYGHEILFNTISDKLKDNTKLLMFPGNLGSLNAVQNHPHLLEQNTIFIEFNTLPYGSRLQEDGSVYISIKAGSLSYSTFPSNKSADIGDVVDMLFPSIELIQSKDIVEVSLNNPNPLFHPTGTIFNIGRIEYAKGDFYMYEEGMTESIMKLIRKKNEERIEMGKALGYSLIGCDQFSGIFQDGTHNSFVKCGEMSKMLGPTSKDNRYITEDVPFGLVYWSRVAEIIGIDVPVINAEIDISSVICGRNFRETGQCFDKFKDMDQLKNYLLSGR